MKKYYLFMAGLLLTCSFLQAQSSKYPEPEFTKEVYYLKKDSIHSLVRLEKENTKMESKTKMGGFGGYESGYVFDGANATVTLPGGTNLSFIISTGVSAKASSPQQDSMMRANGMDPSMMSGMGGGLDIPSMIALYEAEPGKASRKILTQKASFGSKKMQSSDQYTFSVKKIREGYWELVLDKILPKGEYAFNMMIAGTGSSDGGTTVFAFSVK